MNWPIPTRSEHELAGGEYPGEQAGGGRAESVGPGLETGGGGRCLA